ncbi:GTP-binding protein HflX [hydrothermal vent metagenome]|uniref:GTP-binding protein HflX n=1 Tax=hydrothermal vent metagenome TaxID=652676 RepID=A0A1W1CMF9_9ZZZZ
MVFISPFQSTQNNLSEFKQLVKSSGVEIIKVFQVINQRPNAKYFIGSGKVEELANNIEEFDIDVIIFNQTLSPSQERNLERDCKCRVLDRTGLILDIFSLRAQSFEGKLQVELAQLKHLSTRLIRGWTHLERQKGGIGLRGPGETQLETDRRLINVRIKNINRRLEKIDKKRNLARQSRVKNQTPIISLVGYTNAGKSSLFNTITNADVYADDKLFATLDATLRRVILPALGEAVLADTVGFIQDLPHDLISAFKSTLEEVVSSDVLLHIIDCSDENYLEKIDQVNQILVEIGAEKIPTILVMNKIDAIDNFKPRVDKKEQGNVFRVWLSAKNGDGLILLMDVLSQQLNGVFCKAKIKIPPQLGNIRSQIYQTGYIKDEKVDDFGFWELEIQVTRHYIEEIIKIKGIELIWQNKK